MSSSNPSRGRRRTDSAGKNERKNALLLDLATVAHQLQPRVIVAENVRQILTQTLRMGNRDRLVVELLEDRLPRYRFWLTVVNVADYGVPQDRRRAVIVGARSDEAWVSLLEKNRLAPWPRPTHAEHPHDARRPWIALREWLRAVSYEPLDAADAVGARGSDPLHFVPSYDAARYRLVADIPKNSGKSAYDNSTCPNCGRRSVPVDTARCPTCAGAMWNRPIVKANGELRLIRGFQSSYRRMRADRPAATITTNSSHIGSDFKIHPYENRVLSALECADLQSVPRWYDWSEALENGRAYLVRNLIGESFPPYFTYLHGRVLRQLLCNGRVRGIRLATGQVPVQ